MFLCSLSSYAQIADWIEQQIREEINSAISPIVNYNANNMGSFGSYIWESVVSAKCESDLEEKAKEFENFEIDTSFLNRVPVKYPNRDSYWVEYMQIRPQLCDKANSFFHQNKSIRLDKLANFKVDAAATAYIDSLASDLKMKSIGSVLNSVALDSVNLLLNSSVLKDNLLMDLNENAAIAIVLNNHPEAVRVYANTAEVPELRKSTKHLLYWAVYADSHKNEFSKKQKLINPRFLYFKQIEGVVDVYSGSTVIARINKDELEVLDINIMNLIGRPNTTYVFGNNKWVTDNMGRVVAASQVRDAEHKMKCKQKSYLKAKAIKEAVGNETFNEYGYFNDPKYGAPEVLLNVYFFTKTKENAAAIKSAKKDASATMKTIKSFHNNISVAYSDHTRIPASVKLNNTQVVNSKKIAEVKKRTLPDSKKFTYNLGQIKPQHKTIFIKESNSENSSTGNVTKGKGNIVGNTTRESTKKPGAWNGTYKIYSDGYRMSPPPISVFLTLTANGHTEYRGSWVMQIADDDAISSGTLNADVTATESNGAVTLKLSNVRYDRGSDGCYFNGPDRTLIADGSVVARISKKGSSFSIQPVGNMTKYLTDLGGILSIKKTK